MIKNYFRIGWRNLVRHKNYATINIAGLALSIGCALLIFTLVRYHFNFDNFHADQDRIYRVVTEFTGESTEYQSGVPQPLGKAFINDMPYAELVARVRSQNSALIAVTQNGETKRFNEEHKVAFAEPSFFQIFNFPLLQGNINSALSEPNCAVVTEKVAQKYFGDDNPIGKVFRLDNKTDFKITGVLQDIPANTDRKDEVYLSYQNLKDVDAGLARDDSWTRVSSSLQCFVRLKPHISAATVDRAFPAFARKYYTPEDAKSTVFKLQPLFDVHFNQHFDGETDKKYLWAFALVGLFLIVTACVNFINLATAQALSRGKEVGIRKVMGSMPMGLFWQFMAETAIIVAVATLLAFGLAAIALPYLNNLLNVHLQLNPLHQPELLFFAGAIILLVTFLSGAYPGLVLSRFRPVLALKGKLDQKHIGGFSLRRLLVVGQFAISQVLIIGTIVVAAQMHFSNTADPGFSKDNVVLLPVPVSDPVKMHTLQSRLERQAGVKSVSLCFQAPAALRNHTTSARFDNRAKDELWELNDKPADLNYIKTFGLKLAAGRNLFPSDSTREFLVNETVVRKLGLKSPQEIIGKMFHVNGVSAPVVGVVKDFNNGSFRSEIAPIAIENNVNDFNVCAVKVSADDTKAALHAFEGIWSETYPQQLFSYKFFDEQVAKFYENDRMILQLIELFSGIAIFIGCLGLYGLVAFMAQRKTKEIGVRKVLGANVGSVLWLFAKEFSILLLIAFAIAAPLGWWSMHNYLQEFKYRIALGPGFFLIAMIATFFVAGLTVSYRAVKAAVVNPVKSLRSE